MKATTLAAQRKADRIDEIIYSALTDAFGQKKRHKFNQEAVILIEHMVGGPLDPHTQMTLWRAGLEATKDGGILSKDNYFTLARSILVQDSLFDPVTMSS